MQMFEGMHTIIDDYLQDVVEEWIFKRQSRRVVVVLVVVVVAKHTSTSYGMSVC